MNGQAESCLNVFARNAAMSELCHVGKVFHEFLDEGCCSLRIVVGDIIINIVEIGTGGDGEF